jgi:hypothetical protein
MPAWKDRTYSIFAYDIFNRKFGVAIREIIVFEKFLAAVESLVVATLA